MPMHCAAPNCSSRHIKGCGFSFHRFPKDSELRRRWMVAAKRSEVPSDTSVLCSRHFKNSDYQLGGMLRKLRKDAVPSIFILPSDTQIQSSGAKRRRTASNHNVEFKPEMWEDKSGHTQEPVIKVKRPRGRPRKKLKTDEFIHVNGTSIGTPGIFNESVACCALACPNTSDTNVMNRLPAAPNLRHLWVQKIDRLAWIPDVDSALCDIHFESEMWDHNEGGEKSLKHDAVPTLFLHGEAIKSWVTLDNTGKMKKMAVLNQENGDTEEEESYSEEGDEGNQANDEGMAEDIFVKREALEPEIDMVEGNEEVVSRDVTIVRDRFETIFCDTTFSDQQHNPIDHKSMKQEVENVADCLENPLSPETIYLDDQSESNQSDVTNEGENNLKVNISNVKSLVGEVDQDKFYLDCSSPEESLLSLKDRTRMRRRSSSQLSNEFECPICERRLSRRKNLEIHIKKLHPNGELTGSQKRNKMKEDEKTKQGEQQQCFHVIDHPPTPPLPKVLVETAAMITSPMPMDPSPAGGEVKKQFVLIVPKPLADPPPPPVLPITEGHTFSVNVASVPPEKRLALRIKLKELVDAVVHKNLNPERIIIAYDGT